VKIFLREDFTSSGPTDAAGRPFQAAINRNGIKAALLKVSDKTQRQRLRRRLVPGQFHAVLEECLCNLERQLNPLHAAA